MDTESELHRKALDQVASLLSRYENSLLSAEAFRVGVETIWGVLGGVVTLDAFQELMTEANAAIRELPPENHVRLFSDGSKLLAVVRTGEQVRMHTAAGLNGSFKQFSLVTEAAAFAERASQSALSKGLREIPE